MWGYGIDVDMGPTELALILNFFCAEHSWWHWEAFLALVLKYAAVCIS